MKTRKKTPNSTGNHHMYPKDLNFSMIFSLLA